ncbi:hypothetical protein NDI72_21045 (plasmid) [Nitratireductor sp. GZWM139]|nr:IclR family transcriptional regulator C-terminal domain-containing protein [Nitratireductor sp. GZWM139]MDJ1466025.1 hypothetical protein [Nitratireductor sp. GZWM139]
MIGPNRIGDNRSGKTEALKARQIKTFKHHSDLPSPRVSNKLAIPDEIIERSERREITPKTITDPQAIRAKVQEARENGYALALEEVLQGEIAIATALLSPEGRPLGAIHIAGSLSEWDAESFCRRFAPLAGEAAGVINRF